MAYAPTSFYNVKAVAGCFKEVEHDNTFEYSIPVETPFDGYDRKVWVGNLEEYRYARILKTVAYIVVDEDADGNPVVEKWQIKCHRTYNL